MKKLVLALAIVLGLLVLVAGAALLLIKPDALINAHKDRIATLVSEKLGRQVKLGEVTSTVLPRLEARLQGIALAGPQGSTADQLALGSVEVRVDLLDAILSLGKKLTVREISLKGLTLRVARDKQGIWNFQDVLDHMASGSAEHAPAPAEDTPADLTALEGARVERVAIEGARIEIDDASLGRPLAVSDLFIELRDIRLGAPIALSLRAVLEDGTSRSPISLQVTLSELRKDLSFSPMPDLQAALVLGTLALGPWGGLLPADALAPAAGQLSLDLKVEASRDLKLLASTGTIQAAGVVLHQGGVQGKSLDLDVQLDARVDLEAPSYQIRSLAVTGTGVDLRGTLDARSLSPTGLVNADLKLLVQDLARVVAVVPSKSALLPAELTLAGPIQAQVNGNASAVDIGLDLDRAHVAWADAFDKKAGSALNLKLAGKRTGDRLDVPAFQLAVDTARLTGSLSLGTAAGAPMTADLKTGPIRVASLKELLPAVAEALGGGKKVDGSFEIVARASAQGDKQQAQASVKLSDLDVNLSGFSARGSGLIDAQVQPQGENLSLAVKTDLDGLALQSTGDDGSKVLDKPAGMPLKLDLAMLKTPARADIQRANLTLNSTSISATGGASGLDGTSPALDVNVPRLDVAFDDIRRTVPGASSLPAGGSFKGGATFKGNPDDTSTIVADVRIDQLVYDKARIQGTLGITNLQRPNFRFDIQSPYLNIDELLGEEDAAEAKPAGKDSSTADDNPHGLSASTRELLATVSGQGALRIGQARFKGMDCKNFVGKLTMVNGVVTFEALDFDIYGGRISAAGSRFDLPASYTGYTLKFKTTHVDLGQALAAHTSMGQVFSGLVDQNIDVTGRGLSLDDLTTSLDGPVDFNTEALTIKSLDVLGPIGTPLKAVLAKSGFKGYKGFKLDPGGTTLRDLSAWLRFAKGKFSLKKPVRSKTGFGELELSGGGALDRTLDLTGTAFLAPAVINAALGKNLVQKPLAVPLKIGGTWDKPRVTGIDVQGLASSILGGSVTGLIDDAKGQVDAKIDDAKKQAEAAANKAKAQAEAEARKKADEAKKMAEAEARKQADAAKNLAEKQKKEAEAKIKAEADKKKKEAEKKAKAAAEKAKKDAAKKAKGLFGR
ncbi:MAG: AsmA family protein [Pseudomonadota bacterium]